MPMSMGRYPVPPNKKGGIEKLLSSFNGPPLSQNRGIALQIMPRGGLNQPPTQGRTYAITRGQVEDVPNVITAEKYVKLVELIPKLLESVISISTPLKDKVLATVGCLGCKLVIGEREGRIDLIVLAMYDFDVIIGIDWLTHQRAKLDYYRKAIQFNLLVGKGYQGYLATVVDTIAEELNIEDIAVVQEFPNMFPKELPRLPPERDIEFVIELAPGTESISKAPYRMALSELRELKVQMQELLDK
ncbi:uncharacterized protein LOC120289548 [Eucalyptus grandis]|uniref:uncharacterized protein LOC120289548 n=1 Tax=Eucalyptus grandis TaxID=71139 RepID=UPI00192EA233|nr:uncharacterized protein LOC120289548 [Eucalyptus grandis]